MVSYFTFKLYHRRLISGPMILQSSINPWYVSFYLLNCRGFLNMSSRFYSNTVRNYFVIMGLPTSLALQRRFLWLVRLLFTLNLNLLGFTLQPILLLIFPKCPLCCFLRALLTPSTLAFLMFWKILYPFLFGQILPLSPFLLHLLVVES